MKTGPLVTTLALAAGTAVALAMWPSSREDRRPYIAGSGSQPVLETDRQEATHTRREANAATSEQGVPKESDPAATATDQRAALEEPLPERHGDIWKSEREEMLSAVRERGLTLHADDPENRRPLDEPEAALSCLDRSLEHFSERLGDQEYRLRCQEINFGMMQKSRDFIDYQRLALLDKDMNYSLLFASSESICEGIRSGDVTVIARPIPEGSTGSFSTTRHLGWNRLDITFIHGGWKISFRVPRSRIDAEVWQESQRLARAASEALDRMRR